MRRAFILSAALVGMAAATPMVKRESIAVVESGFKVKLLSTEMEILAQPRGLYVEGVGAVFSADIMLCLTPSINPFREKIPDEVQTRIYKKKLQQVPILRENIKETLLNASAQLDTVPMTERIVVGVTIGHENWETTAGLPSQIIMQGQRSKLMEAKAGKASVDSVIKVQEQ